MENVVSLRERKKLKVQKSIVSIAMSLFNKKGFEETTIAEIMKTADLGTGTFYNYFQSKGDIVKYVFQAELDEARVLLLELCQTKLKPAQKVFQMGLILERILINNQQLLKLYMQSYRDQAEAPEQPPHGPLFKDIFIHVIQEGQENGDFRKDVPLEIVTEAFMGLLKSTLNSRAQISVHENLKYKLDMFLDMLEKKE